MAPPVVFVHGWKASVLVDKNSGKTEFDYTLGVMLGVVRDPALELPLEWEADGSQVRDNLVASRPCKDVRGPCGCVKLVDIHGPMLDRIEETRDLRVFAYDWRRCLDETAEKFERFLEGVAESAGGEPQVVAHSMGCLISLYVLNKRPDLFHSVLFGAGAMSPNVSVLEDLSLLGEKNKLVLNDTCLTPKINLSNPSAMYFMAYPGERAKYGKPNTVMMRDADGKEIDPDLHNIATWKKLKLGIYNPNSGVEGVTEKQEAWLAEILKRAKRFREGLLPVNRGNKPGDYPPVAVLRGDHSDTEFSYTLNVDGSVNFKEGVGYLRGDDRVTLEDALPPDGIPVCRVETNSRDHMNVLNDLESLDAILLHLIDEAGKK